jgi:hypothetical protein
MNLCEGVSHKEARKAQIIFRLCLFFFVAIFFSELFLGVPVNEFSPEMDLHLILDKLRNAQIPRGAQVA